MTSYTDGGTTDYDLQAKECADSNARSSPKGDMNRELGHASYNTAQSAKPSYPCVLTSVASFHSLPST